MGSKLGIIFAFLLSLAAAGGSYYLYQGWVDERAVRGSVEAKYDQVQEKMHTVQSEKEKLEVKSEEYRTKAEAMQSQLEKLQAEQVRIDGEKAALKQQLEGHQGMIADLQKKVAELEKKAKDAQAACGVMPADLKTDAFPSPKPFENTPGTSAAAPATVAPGTESSALVFKPVSSGGAVPVPTAAKAVSSAPVPAVTVAAPAVPAAPVSSEPVKETVQPAQVSSIAVAPAGHKVLTVNRKFNFVVINQGLQDGLKMGDKLRVLKQGQEVATIQIEKLYDKFSAATLLEEDPKQQVVEGDEIRKT
jgi:hypothetical protein